MACSITLSGITLDCRDNVGGIEAVYVTSSVDFTSADFAAGAIAVTDVVATGLSDFTEYECPKQTGTLTETGTFSEENGTVFYTCVASAVFNKTTAARLTEVYNLGKSTQLCVMVKDNNGKYWLVGNERGALVSNSTAGTGTAFGDRNGITIEFTGISQLPMIEVTGIS